MKQKVNLYLPTPVIGGVGIIEDLKFVTGINMKMNDSIYVIGHTIGHLESVSI